MKLDLNENIVNKIVELEKQNHYLIISVLVPPDGKGLDVLIDTDFAEKESFENKAQILELIQRSLLNDGRKPA